MSMRITIVTPRRSEDGLSIMTAAGSPYTVSNEFGEYIVRNGWALDTDNVLYTPPSTGGGLSPAVSRQLTALTHEAGGARRTEIPFLVSGLELPTSGALNTPINSGEAEIHRVRVIMGASAPGFAPSKDNYVDLVYSRPSFTGAFIVTAVAIGAAAPPMPSDALRLGFVTTGASTISSATQSGKDSLGNWMGNMVAKPVCSLFVGSGQPYFATTPADVIFGAGTELYDNDYMHSVSANNTRVTINKAGPYVIRGGFTTAGGWTGVMGVAIFKNGTQMTQQLQGLGNNTVNGTLACAVPLTQYAAGDYLTLNINPVANGFNLASAFLEVERL